MIKLDIAPLKTSVSWYKININKNIAHWLWNHTIASFNFNLIILILFQIHQYQLLQFCSLATLATFTSLTEFLSIIIFSLNTSDTTQLGTSWRFIMSIWKSLYSKYHIPMRSIMSFWVEGISTYASIIA